MSLLYKYGGLLSISMLLLAFAFRPKPTPYSFPELKYFPPMPPPAIPVTVEGAELGRFLFYDSILSQGYNMSCATCHKQQRAFSDAPFSFTKGNNRKLTKRNTMPLFNLAWYSSFFWDGRASSIEEQVFHPVRNGDEMNLDWKEAVRRVRSSKFYRAKFRYAFGDAEIDSMLISSAIGQFLRTLISYQSKFDRVLDGKDTLTKDEYEGLVLMNDMTKGDCLHCHTTDADALGTTGEFSNNGLDKIKKIADFKDKGLGGHTGKEYDYGKFKIPSLRNVALTPPYMHDGRFSTLEEVMDFYSSGVQESITIDSKMGAVRQSGVQLSAHEKMQIVAFLKTLTDSVFIANPDFANPFQKNRMK